jgi:hypothetical protein
VPKLREGEATDFESLDGHWTGEEVGEKRPPIAASARSLAPGSMHSGEMLGWKRAQDGKPCLQTILSGKAPVCTQVVQAPEVA